MKKILLLFAFTLLFNACDDGDLTLQQFNFNNETVEKCNSILYVKKGNEILILNIPATNFANVATPPNEPRIFTLTSTDQLLYRSYNGAVSSNTICSSIPPASPVVVSEYKAQPGGKIQIITSILRNVNQTTKATTITYTHQIKLLNVAFKSGESTIKNEEFLFGNYTSLTNVLSFNFFTDNAKLCTPSKLYKNSSSQVLSFEFPDYPLPTVAGTTTVPLNATNFLSYKMYTGANLTDAEICSQTTPNSPFAIVENWKATEGQVKIVTTLVTGTNGLPAKSYSILFENVVYQSGTLNFSHDTLNFGTYLTN